MRHFSKLFVLLFLALNGCTVLVPNVEVCATSAYMSAGADCVESQSGKERELDLDAWIKFLEPDEVAGKGAAYCMSSVDFMRLKTALDQACDKLARCTPEQEKALKEVGARAEALQARVRERRKKVTAPASSPPRPPRLRKSRRA